MKNLLYSYVNYCKGKLASLRKYWTLVLLLDLPSFSCQLFDLVQSFFARLWVQLCGYINKNYKTSKNAFKYKHYTIKYKNLHWRFYKWKIQVEAE